MFFSLSIYLSISVSIFDGSIIRNNNRRIDLTNYFPFTNIIVKTNKETQNNNTYYNKIKSILTRIDNSASERIAFRYKFCELHGLISKLMRINLFLEVETIVLENDYLCLVEKATSPNIIINNIIDFDKWIKNNLPSTNLIYIQYPCKISKYYDKLPNGIEDARNIIADKIIQSLSNHNIKNLDLRENINNQKLNHHDLFFKTDHHWKPETGLWATKEICKYFNKLFNYKFDYDLLSIGNYTKKTIKDSLLGSLGKKLTLGYTKPESINVFYPKFQTKLLLDTLKIQVKGSFDTIFINNEEVNNKNYNYYKDTRYNFYISNYDIDVFYTVTNELSENDLTCLFLVDSYNAVVSPFLALMCKKIIIINPRRFNGSIKTCIKKYQPNIVCIAYTARIPPKDNTSYDWKLYQFE